MNKKKLYWQCDVVIHGKVNVLDMLPSGFYNTIILVDPIKLSKNQYIYKI